MMNTIINGCPTSRNDDDISCLDFDTADTVMIIYAHPLVKYALTQ